MNEYVTSPPCRQIRLQDLDSYGGQLETKREEGVRVWDLLKDVFEMWETSIPEEDRERVIDGARSADEEYQQARAYDDDPYDYELRPEDLLEALESGESITWRSAIPFETRIHSLTAPRVTKDDCVDIKVVWGIAPI
jgi:hypothetical protein